MARRSRSAYVRRVLTVAALAAAISGSAACSWPIPYRPGREERSVSAGSYDLAIQRNGRVNVVLTSGVVVFDNAFPMVWFEDDDKPRPLRIDGRRSARDHVNDPLGEGHGFTLYGKDVEWSIRTYPTQPFLAAQVSFVNSGRKPVRVRALSPWCVGEPNKGEVALSDGPGEAVVFAMGPGDAPPRVVAAADGVEASVLAAMNATGRRTLTAGPFPHDTGEPVIEIGPRTEAIGARHSLFRGVWRYDPPIEVPPGARLISGALYLGVTEHDPSVGLDRYGYAAAAALSRTAPAATGDLSAEALTAQGQATASRLGAHAEPWPADPESLRTLGRRWFLVPRFGPPRIAPLPALGDDDPTPALRAAMTAAALLGSAVEFSSDAGAPSPREAELLHQLRSADVRPARVVDVLNPDGPQVWYLPLRTPIGEWHLIALFNWDDQPQAVSASLTSLGIPADALFSAFGFWERTYYGVVQGRISASIPPGGVRLFGLRPLPGRAAPHLVATDSHFTQGALDVSRWDWDETTGELHGAIRARAGVPTSLWMLLPDNRRFAGFTCQTGSALWLQDGHVLHVTIRPDADGETAWTLRTDAN